MSKRKIICLTPIKNESWILDSFLKSTSLWADKIILLDQNSTDNSRNIAAKYHKVKLIINQKESFDENYRQKILINEARKIGKNNILIALDADEILTPNVFSDPQWKLLLSAPLGTVIKFNWINISPSLRSYWTPKLDLPLGYVDNGESHKGSFIHSFRVPYKENYPSLLMNEVKVLHFQYVDWKRMLSKQRWYQCLELLNNKKNEIDIYRQYHHMFAVSKDEMLPFDHTLLSHWREWGVDIKYKFLKKYWWDEEVIKLINYHGAKRFKKIDIWSTKILQSCEDPRNILDKILIFYLKFTQKYSDRLPVQIFDRILIGLT